MSKTVITSSDLQAKYEKLYTFLMDFLWEFSTVQALADLEISIFKRFPDQDEMLKCLRKLKADISHTYNELAKDDEEDFKDAMEDLEKAIEDFENPGCELYCVEEFVSDSEDVSAADDFDNSKFAKGKRKFNIGDIKHTTKEERELQEEAANTLQNPFEEGEE